MSLRAEIEPVALSSGQELTVNISGASQWARQTVQVQIEGCDDVEMMWLASLSIDIDADGSGAGVHPGIDVVRETVVWVTAIGPDGHLQRIDVVAFSIVGSPEPVERENIVSRYQEISSRREGRYRQPIGSSIDGLTRFRTAYVVENLFITQRLDSRHGTVHPLSPAVHSADLRIAVNTALTMLGWPTRANDATWEANMRRNDLAVIEFPEIWASDWDDAYRKSVREAERYMSAIAYLRHAAPQLVMVVLERDGRPITSKMRSLRNPYKGNLVGGFIAGERQSQFLITDLTLETDHKAALYVSLYLDAQRETQPDSRFFKLWSVLETVATNNVAPGQPVTLEDGTPWPNGETTANAAPKVFELARNAGLAATAWPGGDLYSFLRAVYGRRNATAHYGRFITGDLVQQTKPWYVWAAQTLVEPVGQPGWLWSLEHLVHDIVGSELSGAHAARLLPE